MNSDAGLLVESYLSWIRSQVTAVKLDNDITELTTPFLDHHNDHLQIYATRRGADQFLLTDDGYVLAELKASGVERRGDRRQRLLRELINGYGIELTGDELHVEANSSNLGRRAHNLVQAMLSIDDMFVLAQPRVEAVFFEDVVKFLDDSEIRYSPRAKFAGRSGLDHLVDFVIPKSKTAPERILQVVNSPRRDRIESLLFAASDMKAARAIEVVYFALLNDSKREVPPDIISAFTAYEIQARPWSQRTDLVHALAA